VRVASASGEACDEDPAECQQAYCDPSNAPERCGSGIAGGACVVTVAIASARADLRSRLSCEDGIQTWGECITQPARLASVLARQAPNVLLVDKSLLDRSAFDSLHELRTRFPAMRTLLILDEARPGIVEAILRNRIDGFLLADCPPDACVKAIRAVHRGELWLPRGLLVKALTDLMLAQAGREPFAGPPLTAREEQIVALLRRGCSNKEIARELGIMEDTVKKHLKSVFAKTGVRRRTLLVLRARPAVPQRDALPL
jgi:DNA-binding NarL/FixJ family response regulator